MVALPVILAPPAEGCPFTVSFLREGCPTQIDHIKSWHQLLLTSQIWRTEVRYSGQNSGREKKKNKNARAGGQSPEPALEILPHGMGASVQFDVGHGCG